MIVLDAHGLYVSDKPGALHSLSDGVVYITHTSLRVMLTIICFLALSSSFRWILARRQFERRPDTDVLPCSLFFLSGGSLRGVSFKGTKA